MKTSYSMITTVAVVCLFAKSVDAQIHLAPFLEVFTPTDPERAIITYEPSDGHVEVNTPHAMKIFSFTSRSGIFDTTGLEHPEDFLPPFDVVSQYKIAKARGEYFGTYMDIGSVVPAGLDFDGFTSEFQLAVGFGGLEYMPDPPGHGLYILAAPSISGDYDGNGILEVADIDLLTDAMLDPDPDLATYDENDDGLVDGADRLIWVHAHAGTWYGDANLDGEFNTADFVQVFETGKYETQEKAGWSEGDWNGDGVFDTGDFVIAFEDGGYEQGQRMNALAVPEPTSLLILITGLIGGAIHHRRSLRTRRQTKQS